MSGTEMGRCARNCPDGFPEMETGDSRIDPQRFPAEQHAGGHSGDLTRRAEWKEVCPVRIAYLQDAFGGPVLLGGVAEIPLIRPIKRRIVVKSAGLAGIGRRHTAFDGVLCGKKPFDKDILPDGGTGGVFKQPAELGNAQEGLFAEGGQGQIFKQMPVDIGDYALRQSF